MNILSLKWDEYYETVCNNDRNDTINIRIKVLNNSKKWFEAHEHFLNIKEQNRKYIAGFGIEESKYFGHMSYGHFMNRINKNNLYISEALDQIPLIGNINKKQYDLFLTKFKQALNGNNVACASRLLCMKRPDYFLCHAKKNKKKISHDFGIPQNIDYERYWNGIIEKIISSPWWNSEEPSNQREKEIWNGRVAFLDLYYYDYDTFKD